MPNVTDHPYEPKDEPAGEFCKWCGKPEDLHTDMGESSKAKWPPSACGKSTMVYHNEVGFIVFCVSRQSHQGSHHADVNWEDETEAPDGQ